MAGEAKKSHCTLQNDFFCDKWQDTDGYDVIVTGDSIRNPGDAAFIVRHVIAQTVQGF